MNRITNVMVVLFLLLVGCDTANPAGEVADTSTSSTISPIVRIVGGTVPEYRIIRIEKIPQYNCGGNEPVDTTIEKERNIVRVVELGSDFAVSTGGEVGIAGTGVQLGAEIASHFGVSYGVGESIARSLTVRASPKTFMTHEIALQEVWEVGTAIVVIDEAVYEIPFSFRSDFSVDLVNSFENTCDDGVSTENHGSESAPIEAESVETEVSTPIVVEVISPRQFLDQHNIPNETFMTVTVPNGEIHAMTAGPICVADVCLEGGEDRGSVVIFLPEASYEVSGLNPTYNWHGAYYASVDQWQVIADKLVDEQKIPGTCDVSTGCGFVDVVVVSPTGVVAQYEK